MNICYVIMQFPVPSETFAAREIRELNKMGASVWVCAMRPPHRDAKQLTRDRGIDDLSVSHGGISSILRGIFWGLKNPIKALDFYSWVFRSNSFKPRDLLKSLVLSLSAFAIFEAIRERKPDVVHLYWGHYPSLVGYLVGEHLPEVCLTVFLGAYDLARRYPGTVHAVEHSRRVFTHAKANIDDIQSWLNVDDSKLRVIYRGIETAKTDKVRESTDRDPVRIVTAGRLIPEKRMDLVIRIVALLRNEFNEVSLIIMGEGPDERRLVQLCADLMISDSVHLIGHVAEDEVFRQMAKSSVFILMSNKVGERLPNVVKEAMACGCICIASRTPGIVELIDDGVNGFIVDPGDVESACDTIKKCLKREDNFGLISNQAVIKIRRQFEVQKQMLAYYREWKSIISE